MIIAGTGHRPEDTEGETIVRTKARTALRYSPVDVFICGMAAGFDLWAGDEARLLGIEVWAARPWASHGPRSGDEELYEAVLNHASKVVNVVDSANYPGPHCYHLRNHWMVDNASHILSYLNPEKLRGGTFECVKYARGKEKPIRNIWVAPPF